MNILHISTSDSGGAGLCSVRIHKGLLENGFKSKVLVLNKIMNEPEVYKFEKEIVRLPKIYRWPIQFIKLVLKKIRIPASQLQYLQFQLDDLRGISNPVYSLPLSEYDLSSHHLVKEADIIHLHWISGFLDWPSFFFSVNKPIVWTIHDENLYYGGFHYSFEQIANISVYQKLEENLIEIKQKSIRQCKNLTIVSLSEMMFELSLSNNIVKNRKHFVINNPVDGTVFKPLDKKFCREIFNLPQHKTILLFVSYYLNVQRKGFSMLVKAVNELNLPDLVICAVGIGNVNIDSKNEIYYPGAISDQRILSLVYSACDYFLLPSLQEAFAQTPLEAMACGLPVVAFPCSGISELINEKNGVRADDFTIEALKEGILRAIKTEYDRDWIRQDVIKRFGVKRIVELYKVVYNEILKKIISK